MTSAFVKGFARAEDTLAALALLAMAVLPIAEVVVQQFSPAGIPGSLSTVKHLTLWVGFLGAAIAAREGKLLSLATGTLLPEGRPREIAGLVAATVTAAVAGLLTFGGIELVQTTRAQGGTIGPDIPTWIAQLVLPVSFGLIAVRAVWRAGFGRTGRVVAALGLVAAALVWRSPDVFIDANMWPGILLVVVAAVLGAPIFVLLGGVGVLLWMTEGQTAYLTLLRTYSLSTSDTIPAIPLFTLAGFLLAEGRSSERLLRVFRAWFGWIPGGTAVVCACLCSFFTVFTGGSGVTILALGGLLFPALIKEGYRERFSLGLLTASGSLGLLLPPALPLIVYAVVAQQPIENMFLGGILPGILMTTLIAAWGVREGIVSKARHTTFTVREALASLWEAKWELVMPVVVLVSLFWLQASTISTAALTALYALVVQTVIHRDLSIRRNLLGVFAECLTIVGGVIVILGVAVGLTRYLIGAEVPDHLLIWTQRYVSSPLTFLLILNLFLLVVGCLMDIFSATVVVVPLITGIGAAYHIDPVHLGIIFVANLELGYLTPPVGLNLFLASYRFKRPMMEITRAALPMLAILGIGVLLITYVPWLTTGILRWLGR